MTIAAAALAVAAIGTGYEIYSGQQQQKAANQATEYQRQQVQVKRKQADLANLRNRRLAARTALQEHARAIQAGANLGGPAGNIWSSSGQTAAGSVQQGLATGFSFLDRMGALQQQSYGFGDLAAGAASTASYWGAQANYGQQVAGFSGPLDKFGMQIAQG